ncbi:tyrosine-type recombinase/integrase [Rhizobiales bacterium RZME27]|uniref:Tyrosine-type recombinase/integrase n=1 Tax=Endobacterium cereale TaxID=2663029 RepID=A0A6A8AJM3_9HYPH|nr:site-specific integrase [Endobacterium cereale]MQY50087.1 tyrosine-type recombinase/integrase [Endobacterium cereale]
MAQNYRLYLHPNGIYYHRVKVPADIRRLYGKEIEQQSLKTRVLREAVRLLPAVIVDVDRAFANFREEYAAELPPASQRAPIRIDVNARLRGVCGPESRDLPLMSVIGTQCFEAIGSTKHWSPKTRSARASHLKQFLEICGDKPLNKYTQEDIRILKSTLFALPRGVHNCKLLQSYSKLEIASQAKKDGVAGLSAESVRQIMTSANIVFGWARVEHDFNLRNVVQPMVPKPSSVGNKRDKRHGFTTGELQKLFTSPVFTGVKSQDAWYEPGSLLMHPTGRFWIPLLCLYAGMRLMEAVQLLREDIDIEDGIWFIDVNDNDAGHGGKTLKTRYSARRIPIHPALIRLGFIEFVNAVPFGERLFADIAIGPPAQRHRYASKMFNKLLLKAGIKSAKKVWHSLRHSFEQACRESRVDSAIMDQLQGHAQVGMRAVYGNEYSLEVLKEGLCSVEYEGLDLSHIQPFRDIRDPDEACTMLDRSA